MKFKGTVAAFATMSNIVRPYGTADSIIPCIYVLFQPIVTAIFFNLIPFGFTDQNVAVYKDTTFSIM
jgi:hypothetical protein